VRAKNEKKGSERAREIIREQTVIGVGMGVGPRDRRGEPVIGVCIRGEDMLRWKSRLIFGR
jgi:hypothetical protein